MGKQKFGQLCFYKKGGAARFSLKSADRNEAGFVTREGVVFLELAAGSGQDANGFNKYDWEKKATFAIGLPDLALLFESLESKLVHSLEKSGQPTSIKTMEIKKLPAKDDKPSNKYWLSIVEKKDTETSKWGVALTVGEIKLILKAMDAAIPEMIGWTNE